MASFDLKAIITAEDRASATIGKVGGSITSTMGGIGTSIAKYGALLTAASGAAVGFAVKNAADVQMLRQSFDTLLGSAEKGKKLFSDLQKMANITPFETQDLAQSAQMLLSYGINIEKILPSLQMLGDVSLGNQNKFKMLSLAFSQVAANGRLMGQDLLQMTSQGFNPLQIISEKTGKSMADLKKKMEDGGITFEMVNDAFKSATSEGGKFYKGMENGSRTLTGLFSTLSDNIKITARSMVGLSETGEIVKGGLLDKVSAGMQNMIAWLDANKAKISEVATAIAVTLGNALTWLWGAIQTTINFLKEHKTAALALAIGIGVFVAAALIAAGVIFVLSHGVIFAVAAIAAAVGMLAAVVIMNWDKIKEWTVNIWTSILTFFIIIWNSISSLFINYLNSFVGFWTNTWNSVSAFFVNLWNGVLGFIRSITVENIGFIIGYMAGAFVNFFTVTLPNAWESFKNYLSSLPERVSGALINFYNTIADWFNRSKDSAKNSIADMYNSVISWFGSLPERIAGALVSLKNVISSGFKSAKDEAIRWVSDTIDSIVGWFKDLPKKISDAYSSAVGKTGGIISKFLGGVSKGFNIAVEQRALGGYLAGGQPSIVGERGPELFVPSSSGRIIPNSQTSNAFTINFYGNINNTDNRSLDDIGKRLSRSLQLASQGI